VCPKISGQIRIEHVAKTGIYHKRAVAPSLNWLKTWDLARMTEFSEKPEELSPDAEGEWGNSRRGDEDEDIRCEIKRAGC
jgi:hypothetical protein